MTCARLRCWCKGADGAYHRRRASRASTATNSTPAATNAHKIAFLYFAKKSGTVRLPTLGPQGLIPKLLVPVPELGAAWPGCASRHGSRPADIVQSSPGGQ